MRYLLAALCVIVCTGLRGQEYKQICSERYKLNSTGRAAIQGVSKVCVPLNIPTGATHGFYSISTDRSTEPNPVKLAAQLADLTTKGIPVYSTLATLVTTTGDIPVSTYLVPNNSSRNAFLNSTPGGYYIQDASRQNLQNGTIDFGITPIEHPQTLYLCIANNEIAEAVYVNVEAVAVIPAPTANNGWTAEKRKLIFDYLKTTLSERMNRQQREAIGNNFDALVNCFVDKICENYTTDRADELQSKAFDRFAEQHGPACAKDLGLE